MKKIIIFAALAFAGCSEVQVTVPNPRVEPPELRGDRGLAFTAGVEGAHVYQATSDGGRRPPTMDEPSATGAFALNGGVHFSPVAPVQIGLELNGPDGYGASTIVKFQIAGEGTHSSKPGDFSALIYLRGGGVYGQKSGDQSQTFGAGGYNWKGHVSGAYAHAGASMGFRVAEHALIYWGGAFGQYWMSSEVDQDAHTSTGDKGGSYKSGDNGKAYTGGFGAEFNWSRVQFFVSGEGTSYGYEHTHSHFDPFVHAGVIITPP